MYDLYHPHIKNVQRNLKKQFKKLKGQRREAFLSKYGIGPSFFDSMDRAALFNYFNLGYSVRYELDQVLTVLVPELLWRDSGCLTVFPESLEFLEMLADAKLSLAADSLFPLEVPISIAYPRGATIKGKKLVPCLIAMGEQQEFYKQISGALQRFLRRTKGREYPWGDFPSFFDADYEWSWSGAADDLHMVSVVEFEGGFFSLSIVEEKIESFLEGEEKPCGEDDIDTFPGAERTDEQDEMERFQVDMALRLIVYMQTFPDRVIKGFPEDVIARLGKLPVPEMSPVHIKSPSIKKGGTHDSPKTHWRQWHFRRYPIQPDGSRTKGAVFVHGSMVNEDVDPRTVVKKGRKA